MFSEENAIHSTTTEQFGFRKGHSTTTILIKLRNYILLISPKHFDTVDYPMLVKQVYTTINISN